MKNSRQFVTDAFKRLQERVTRSGKKKQERSGFRNEEEEKENQRLGQVEDENLTLLRGQGSEKKRKKKKTTGWTK